MVGNRLGYCDDHRRGGHRSVFDHSGDSCGEPMTDEEKINRYFLEDPPQEVTEHEVMEIYRKLWKWYGRHFAKKVTKGHFIKNDDGTIG